MDTSQIVLGLFLLAPVAVLALGFVGLIFRYIILEKP